MRQKFFDKNKKKEAYNSEEDIADSSEEECISENPTDSLFDQLEKGYNQYTDIPRAIKSGANLYAKKEGKYPIHLAAHYVDRNTAAIKSILRSFNDPEKRKEYIFLKCGGKNALEILLEENADAYEQENALPSIISILSFLTAQEQKKLIDSLSQKAKDILNKGETEITHQDDIEDFATLNAFLKSGKTIGLCKQRQREEEKLLKAYESDEESLGQLDAVYNKKFTARVSYKDHREKGIVVNSIPELVVIPSDWRLATAVKNNQGDHVTAYVLLLSSFSHCKGENVKELPELIYNLAISVLPDDQKFFQQEKQNIAKSLEEYRNVRVAARAALKAYTGMDETMVMAAENNLKKAEIELIASYIENTIDSFIAMINKQEDESFSQKRKDSLTKKYILQQLILVLGKRSELIPYVQFSNVLIQAIQAEAAQNPNNLGITDQVLEKIVDSVMEVKLLVKEIPKELVRSKQLSRVSFLEFLKNNTPYKKYHEGHVITEIKRMVLDLQETTNKEKKTRNNLLQKIGFLCYKLFDYPCVNDESLNDETVLYQAIPRHWIIINAAFGYLKELTVVEKKTLYDVFLNNILRLQRWENHLISIGKNKSTPLSFDLLEKNILKFASLDVNHNFSMKTTRVQVLEEEEEDNSELSPSIL